MLDPPGAEPPSRRSSRPRRALVAPLLAWSASGLVAGLFGAGYVARWSSADGLWPLQVVAVSLPGTSLAVGVGAAAWTLGWARRRTASARAMSGAFTALLVLAAARYAPDYGATWTGARATTGPALRVASLNLGADVEDSFLAGQVVARTVRPDLVGLQETVVRRIETTDGDRIAGPAAALGLLAGGDYVTFTDRYLRLSVLGGSSLVVEPSAPVEIGREGDERSGTAIRHEVLWGGRRIAVYVVHLRSYSREGPGWRRRLRQVRRDLGLRAGEARALRETLEAEDLPFLVLGDLNATPDQWAYHHVADGLVDALSERRGWRPTYPDALPILQIDAVLGSPEWTVDEASTLPAGLSDHRGVAAVLRLRHPAAPGREGRDDRPNAMTRRD